MIWHFRQANIAAGSLILWIALHNFFNSVNALIWPRDNVLEWWDGPIWCDIHVRIQVGSYVGMTASVAMVIRKLAIVMDTRNMTVSTSRNSKIKAKIWEVVWCWVVPGFFIALYYVVQPVRYMIYGIVGCLSAHDSSWPSVVLGFMWPTIGMLFASYWACKSHLFRPSILTNLFDSSTCLPSLPLPSRIPPPNRRPKDHIIPLCPPLHP
jgi:pheromone a factor receptor